MDETQFRRLEDQIETSHDLIVVVTCLSLYEQAHGPGIRQANMGPCSDINTSLKMDCGEVVAAYLRCLESPCLPSNMD